MNFAVKAVLAISMLGLAACSNPDQYGSGATGPGGALGPGGAGMDGVSQGGINDPNSPAYFSQTIGDMVHFMVDQSTLTDTARGILTQQASWLVSHPSYTAIIEGHADEQGTREYNLALGARRASAVQEYLISQGVAGNRLRTVSYGKERPLAICSTEECYQKNRRAVTVISQSAVGS
ncbi:MULTISPECIES: peptidoglycan-associated lipoprotein Pal [Thioclava]|uniref:peptidoglycan-associated lipoprotein Pal n=1 Tax=Thioclava TaxID=285107 RepID=UPI0009974E5E|nr:MULTISPECIES: peptidoglycan-associated lipoprotein Pal [Thioclava]MAQ35794.1 peptidoglycan-associated lipoprotein [Thioclava sp.]MPQ95097.1 peptidoglycan-associated lipoprotein Pal [Thioclava sp. JE_KL1]OOY08044.1 peptidoglycan-associated lipoprotein [Thioclava sp. F36-7]OOY32469.1 peptidoglycan-associated lipoprotein [Thioclava sp. F36-6]|tara:strand:- start:970 stop:1503 length:534 start_codon:yes stop_codon:yes gene_type:complete